MQMEENRQVALELATADINDYCLYRLKPPYPTGIKDTRPTLPSRLRDAGT